MVKSIWVPHSVLQWKWCWIFWNKWAVSWENPIRSGQNRNTFQYQVVTVFVLADQLCFPLWKCILWCYQGFDNMLTQQHANVKLRSTILCMCMCMCRVAGDVDQILVKLVIYKLWCDRFHIHRLFFNHFFLTLGFFTGIWRWYIKPGMA